AAPRTPEESSAAPSASRCLSPSPWHARLGLLCLSADHLTRRQDSRDVAARALAPSVEAPDAPLGAADLPNAGALLLSASALTQAGLAPAGPVQLRWTRHAGMVGRSANQVKCTGATRPGIGMLVRTPSHAGAAGAGGPDT